MHAILTSSSADPMGTEQVGSEMSPLVNALEPILVINNVEVRYQGTILVLKNVSLKVGEGEIVALLGSNGAGKTTTLKSISSLIQAEEGRVTEGQITFLGLDIQNVDPVSIVRKGLVQVVEGRRVLEHLTVEQNLIVASAPIRATRQQVRNEIDAVYEIFPILSQFRDRQSGYLSGGQQQMLVIGRALMAKPRLLLLDEPSLGLSPMLVTTIFESIVRINRDLGTSILLVEQNAKVALGVSQRGYILENGRIVMEGTREELLNNDDLKEFYLGINASGDRKNFRDIKQYRRRRRWLG
jgi:branched-chain amino acid transport system ATP-binding protein